MVDVQILVLPEKTCFTTQAPKIPNKGETIGLWSEGIWGYYDILKVSYNFDSNGVFSHVEINVISNDY